MNLAAKYRPKTFEDVTEQELVVNILRNMCKDEKLENRNFLLIGSHGCGKAQPLYSEVLTPQGFKLMGDVHEGDQVFTSKGNIATVTDVYPQGIRPIYEITLQDRTTIRVADNHLNCVWWYDDCKKKRVDAILTTTELIDKFNSNKATDTNSQLRIDNVEIDWPESQVPIDPYLLGALIGDGSLSNGNLEFSNSEQDVIDNVDHILRRDWECYLRKVPGDNVDYSIVSLHPNKFDFTYQGVHYTRPELIQYLKKLYPKYDDIDPDTLVRIAKGSRISKYSELCGSLTVDIDDKYIEGISNLRLTIQVLGLNCKSVDKHIPKCYLYNSREIRLRLLQGLYDTDGYTSAGMCSASTFTTSSPQLSEDFAFLVRSLGIRDTVSMHPSFYKGKQCDDSYDHSIKVYDGVKYFTSEKHSSRWRPHQTDPYRNIVSIEHVGDEECQCIMLDHPDHTYVSDNFIPTHNTTLARCCANILNNNTGEPIEIDAASHGGVDDMREIVDQAHQYPIGAKWKIFIIDECFHKDSKVSTPKGDVPISSIQVGDAVYGLDGEHTVTQVFENRVPVSNLLLVHTNQGPILTTKSHLFMTSEGWIAGEDLLKGDQLYAKRNNQVCDMRKGVSRSCLRSQTSLWEGMRRNTQEEETSGALSKSQADWLHKTMSNMQQRILYTQEREFQDMFNQLWSVIQPEIDSEDFKEFARIQVLIYLSDMWEARDVLQIRTKDILFSEMHDYSEISRSTSETTVFTREAILYDMWQRIHSEKFKRSEEDMFKGMPSYMHSKSTEGENVTGVIQKDEGIKSNEQSSSYSENAAHKRDERDIAQAICSAWWEWFIHPASALAPSEFESEVGIGICDNYSCDSKRQSEPLCLQLQSRPRTSRYSTSDRSGWCRPQYEIAQIVRSKEGSVFGESWVEGVEVYKPGDNDESFERYFESKELRNGFVTLYDLEVSGHPSYYVNNVLVHNCHAMSQSAWSAALKLLEEQPARSVFFLATTNPEKIPSTILSRVQKFQISKISLSGIESRLKYIIECENKEGRNITFTDDAIQMIAKLANGGMRDAITLMDKALAYSEDLTIENLEKSLDMPSYEDYFEFLNALARKDNAKIIDIVNTVYNSGTNYVKWMENFHSFICNIIKYIFLQDIGKTMIPSTYQDKISKYSTQHAILCLRLANKLVKLNQELKSTQYLQEYTISELCEIPAQSK